MSSTLKTLLSSLSETLERIDENHGEIMPEVLPVLRENEVMLAAKVDNYVGFIECVQSQIQQQKSLIDKCRKNVGVLEKLEERLKENAVFLMTEMNITELRGEERSIKVRNTGGVQAIDEPTEMKHSMTYINPYYLGYLPNSVYEEKLVHVLKQKEYRIAVEAGDIPACSLKPRKKTIKLT